MQVWWAILKSIHKIRWTIHLRVLVAIKKTEEGYCSYHLTRGHLLTLFVIYNHI